VHSFVDWTWFIPGCTAIALLCAGWVAGRGPLRQPPPDPPPLRGPRAWPSERLAIAGALLAIVTAVGVAWAVWQPLRSLDATNAALAKLEAGDFSGAQRDARVAADRNPLSIEPLSVLAVAQSRAGDDEAALQTLKREVKLQPSNPEPWLRLGDFQFNKLKRPAEALKSVRTSLYLDPHNPQTIGAYLVVLRAAQSG
jgi:Flp pilus assembly protein TadD